MAFFSRQRMADYFLEQQNPYSKRRPINVKNLYWALGIALGLFALGVAVLGAPKESSTQVAKPDFHTPPQAAPDTSNQGTSFGQGRKSEGNSFSSNFFSIGGKAGGSSTRGRSADQVVRRGAGGNDPEATLPLGSTIPVRLVNSIVSSQSGTPVIAEVTNDVYVHGSLSIPAFARAIGTALYDEGSRRVQLRFQTLVYPEGDQHGVQAVGLMQDGTAGLSGDYHSEELKRQSGRVLSNFLGGMASGIKDRETAGQAGIPYEPGSLKNGLLNGVTLTGQDQAKAFSESLSSTKPFMTLPAGESFVIFLEQAFVP